MHFLKKLKKPLVIPDKYKEYGHKLKRLLISSLSLQIITLIVSSASAILTYKAVSITERRLVLEDNRILIGLEAKLKIQPSRKNSLSRLSIAFNFKDGSSCALLEVEWLPEGNDIFTNLSPKRLFKPWVKEADTIRTINFFNNNELYSIALLPESSVANIKQQTFSAIVRYNGIERILSNIPVN